MTDSTLWDFVFYVEYYKNVSWETLSKLFFLHPSYLSRAFKQKFNISFSDYLKNIRINKVMILFKYSDKSITEIAKETGFDSTTSLCRAFKRIIAIPPFVQRGEYVSVINVFLRERIRLCPCQKQGLSA